MMGFDFSSFVAALAWLSVVTMRLAVAFYVAPFFAPTIFTGLARSTIIVVIALVPMVTIPVGLVDAFGPWQLIVLLLREAFVGLLMGFLLGVPIWVMQNVGALVDTLTGSNSSAVFDPLSGHEGGALGSILQTLFVTLFFAVGGFSLITTAMYDSYRIWPIGAALPDIDEVFRAFWIQKGDEIFVMTVKLAAPLAVALLMVDLTLGLLNRSAPQFNVFSLAPAIKGAVTILVLYLVFAFFTERVLNAVRDALNMPNLLEAFGGKVSSLLITPVSLRV